MWLSTKSRIARQPEENKIYQPTFAQLLHELLKVRRGTTEGVDGDLARWRRLCEERILADLVQGRPLRYDKCRPEDTRGEWSAG